MRSIAASGCLLAFASILLSAPLSAQEIRGVVRRATDSSPVSGAIVVLTKVSGGRLTGALTGDDGSYTLRAPAAGQFALYVDVLGLRRTALPPFDVASGETVVRDVAVRIERVALPAVSVTASSRCEKVIGESGEAARLWDEARKSLEATRMAVQSRRYPVTLERHERTISLPDSTVLASRTSTERGVTDEPFVSIGADSIRRVGFRGTRAGDTYYFAPDAAVLLSDYFVQEHCFRSQPGSGAMSSAVGLAFRPMRADRRVEVEGVLWLDSATAELRRLEYRYVPASGRASPQGEVEFGHLPSGAFGVTRWQIRMPVLTTGRTRRPDGAFAFGPDTIVTAFRDEGGEVVATPGSARMLGSHTSRIRARLWDSTQAAPLAGATVTVEGLGVTAMTGADGEALVDSLSAAGLVRVRYWHPRFDSLGIGVQRTTVRLTRGDSVVLALATPSVATLAAARCRASATDSVSLIIGTLRGEDAAIAAADVSLLVAGPDGTRRRFHAETSETGRFEICAPGAGRGWLMAGTGPTRSAPAAVPLQPATATVRDLRIAARAAGAIARDASLAANTRSGVSPLARGPAAAGHQSTLEGWVLGATAGTARITTTTGARSAATTDTAGAFRVVVPAGPTVLTINAPGFAPASVSATLREEERLILLVDLVPITPPREARAANAGVPGASIDWTRGFDERRRRGRGSFFTREEIDRLGAHAVSDVLRGVPGVQVIPANSGYRFVSARARELTPLGRACDMLFYVDGRPFTVEDGNIEVEVRPAEIDAMEVYVAGSDAPPMFSAARARCGVVAIWRSRR